MPWQGGSNEYLKHMFLCRNKKINNLWLKKKSALPRVLLSWHLALPIIYNSKLKTVFIISSWKCWVIPHHMFYREIIIIIIIIKTSKFHLDILLIWSYSCNLITFSQNHSSKLKCFFPHLLQPKNIDIFLISPRKDMFVGTH